MSLAGVWFPMICLTISVSLVQQIFTKTQTDTTIASFQMDQESILSVQTVKNGFLLMVDLQFTNVLLGSLVSLWV